MQPRARRGCRMTDNLSRMRSCFALFDGGFYPVKRDYRFGFYNDIVSIKVHDGLRITALLAEARTGRRASCSE
jgi:hypothetical protein